MNQIIKVANLKCSGCANSIQSKLGSLEGMEQVKVDIENDEVSVNFQTPLLLDTIKAQLLSMGYPEATEHNGLLTQLKSYASCMIGRIN
jgi:copper chaperone